jgi:hypothetical protein
MDPVSESLVAETKGCPRFSYSSRVFLFRSFLNFASKRNEAKRILFRFIFVCFCEIKKIFFCRFISHHIASIFFRYFASTFSLQNKNSFFHYFPSTFLLQNMFFLYFASSFSLQNMFFHNHNFVALKRCC